MFGFAHNGHGALADEHDNQASGLELRRAPDTQHDGERGAAWSNPQRRLCSRTRPFENFRFWPILHGAEAPYDA